ncbi:EpsG family protein [Bifidobacterium olomucense]|uniref:Polysaccharide polymerase n=1 Tax=Bifidobacterium olomucense TaxID=2675324 RepID=A0A7Y0EZ90_9BIFI|nr:EpsG family protein [Bifidobacterium sp. DSM 109959]NMM99128.1 polysaccharide polymerase [Bifidobacterium sp. DSM 109959]
MIYILVFIISSIFSCTKLRLFLTQKKSLYIDFSLLLTILPITILAGLRNHTVGTDVDTYVIGIYERVNTYINISQVLNNHNVEIGYEIFAFLIAHVFHDVHWLHFLTTFVTGFAVYSFLKLYENEISIPLAWFSFLCLHFNETLNIVRQWLALGICLLCIGAILKKKKILSFFLALLAISFHSSAIIIFVIYAIYKFLTREYKISINRYHKYCTFLIIMTSIGAAFFRPICMMLLSFGILPLKYIHYFDLPEGISSPTMLVLSIIPFIILCLFVYKYQKWNNEQPDFIIIFTIISCILTFLSTKFGYAARIGLFFSVWRLILIGKTSFIIQKRWPKQIAFFMKIPFIALLIAYWWYSFYYRGFGDTVPYISDIFQSVNWTF